MKVGKENKFRSKWRDAVFFAIGILLGIVTLGGI